MSAKDMMRKVAKRLASPLTNRLYDRIDTRAVELRESLNGQMAELAAHLEAFDRYLPTVINVIASQNAQRRESERRLRDVESGVRSQSEAIARISERMELIGREGQVEEPSTQSTVGLDGSAQVRPEQPTPKSRVTNEE